MIPCRLCSAPDEQGRPSPLDKDGKLLRGLKQVGKTKLRDVVWKNKFGEVIAPGAAGERFYRCQDCGAFWRFTYDAVRKTSHEEPVFQLLKGGGQ